MRKIFLGEIKSWNDDSIKKMNPGLKLPQGEIIVVYRSDGSGTTAIFTHYLAGICPVWKEKVGAGKAVKFPAGIGGKGNEGVANYVKRMPNAIGYVEFAYAKQNKLDYIQLKNKAGSFVEPGFASFEDAAETGDFDPKTDSSPPVRHSSLRRAEYHQFRFLRTSGSRTGSAYPMP